MVREQGRFTRAATVLIENAREDMAVEMAANVWRLWILFRGIGGGHHFLATVLDKTETGKTSLNRALALYGGGRFVFREGRLEESRKKNEEALRIAQLIGDSEA